MPETSTFQIKPILLILDNNEDIYNFQEVFATINPSIPVIYVKKIRESFDYFQGEGIYNDRSLYPLPQLVLLDLNLPDGSSFHFLEWLKLETRFKNLPIVLFGEQCDFEYKQLLLNYGAEFFLYKPLPFCYLVSIFQSICHNLILDRSLPVLPSNVLL